MNLTNRFISGMFSGLGNVVVRTGLNILLIPVLNRALGIEQYSLYVLLAAVLEFALIMDLGFTSGVVQLLGSYRAQEKDDKAQELTQVAQTLYGGLSLLVLVLGLCFVPFFPTWFHLPAKLVPLAEACLAIIVVESAVSLYANFFRGVLVAHCLNHWTNIGDSLYSILGNVVGLGLILSGWGLEALMFARLGAALIRAGMMMRLALREEPDLFRFSLPFRLKPVRELCGISAHAMMINLSIYLSHGIDTMVIATFMPLEKVGLYEILLRCMSLTVQLGGKLCDGLFPIFTRLVAAARNAEARELFLRMSFLINFLTVMMLTMIVTFYPELFAILSAGKYDINPTWPILWLMVPIFWSGGLQLPASHYLFSAGHQKYLTSSSILAAVNNFLLSLTLVQNFGLVGVVVGTLVPQLVQHQAGLIRMSCRNLNISFKEYMKRVHGPLLIPMAGTILWIRGLEPILDLGPHPLISLALIASSSLLVGGGLWYFITASEEDRRLLMTKILVPMKAKLSRKGVSVSV